jgi:hypothetical protein
VESEKRTDGGKGKTWGWSIWSVSSIRSVLLAGPANRLEEPEKPDEQE